MLATLLLPLFLLTPPQERPTATGLVDQARSYLPEYTGEHRPFLTSQQESAVRAANHILSAALSLDPKSTYAKWWKGHTYILLGENHLNRGEVNLGSAYYRHAMDCFDQAVWEDETYAWGYYARAMVHMRLGEFYRAQQELRMCIGLANSIAKSGDETARSESEFIRYKARLWSAECSMRVYEFEKAREQYRSFYADNGNNAWDLGIKIAETYQRERAFLAAIQTYEELLNVPEYADYHGAYNYLGYLEGLLENPDKAAHRLNQALERERQPTLYPRLWLWILAPDEQKQDALDQLNRFLTHPPANLSHWDLKLGRFLTGEGTQEEFLTQARVERARRKIAAQSLDNLMCEVWFYAGLRQEWRSSKDEAIAAYKKALAFRPIAFKWEWAYARLHFARLLRSPENLPSGLPNNAPPGVHRVYLYQGGPDGLGDMGLEELREHASKGDLILSFSGGSSPFAPKWTPQMEVVGVPQPTPPAKPKATAPPKAAAKPN